MEHNILVTGKMINKMERAKRFGQIMQVIRDNIKMEKRMEKVHSNGQMDQYM